MTIKSIVSTIVGMAAIVVLVVATPVILLVVLLRPSSDEIATIESPNGEILAKLIEVNGGATTSYGYEVYLSSKNSYFDTEKVAFLYGALKNKSAYGVNLVWVGNEQLHIEYLTAISAELIQSKWSSYTGNVTIIIKPGVKGNSIPSSSGD